ncbi:MAG: U32 family peptidase, partial [Spirochaetales bacterium]
RIASLPLDALIVSDIGVVPLIRSRMPDIELHLSTQANCLNSEAARMYMDMGFSRIIPAREMSLADLAGMKEKVPALEVEVFVHGAMCLAYSGRCLLSAWQAGRSGNKGDCAHSCRWKYRQAIEEAKRPGEYLPVEEGDGFTTILSPKDICMIDHLSRLSDAGIDAIKIEGRVKSAYYVAMVTRAYRKELDRLASGGDPVTTRPFIDELYNVSHREFSTGFYFEGPDSVAPTDRSYNQKYRFMATVQQQLIPGRFALNVKNGFAMGDPIEFVGPDLPYVQDTSFRLFALNGDPVERITHHTSGLIEPSVSVAPGYLVRMPMKQTDSDAALS